nr:hypothetical protein [Tanacetum cinerariifolium]
MQNLEDNSDLTTAINKALDLIAKAFKLNTILTNNNQRSSLIPCNSQIAQPDINTSQDIKMKMVDNNVGNQVRQNDVQNDGNEYGNRNVVTAPGEGNGNGINGNPIRCYNCRGEGHYASNYTVKSKKRDAAYLQQQLQIAQEEEAGIHCTEEEFEFMAVADAYKETERVKINCTSEDTLQQASTSGTKSDNAPVYDPDGSNELQAQLGDLKGKSSDNQCASNTIDPVSQKPGDENMSLESQVLNYAKENAHLKTTYKNLFDSIKVTQAQTNSIIDFLQKQSYENEYLVYKAINLRKPPSSSYKPKLYSVTLFPKSLVLPKVDKTNALSKPVTLNSAPFTRESKVVQTVNVISPRIFRTNPSKTFRVDNVVPNKLVKTSVRIKWITVSQPNVIHKQQANSDSNGFSSTRVNNTNKTRRPYPRSNSNTDMVSSKCKQCLVTANHDVCVLNYVNDMNSRADNQSANVLIHENQKKHKENAKKLKALGSKGSLASSRPSKPRTCLRWIPTGRIFATCEKLTTSSNTKNKSEKSVRDNASTSNPSKPSSKGFLNSASLLGSYQAKETTHFYLSDCHSLIFS